MASLNGGVSKTSGGLAALFNRPKTEYVDKVGEEISVSPRPSDLIYIRNCKQCKFRVQGKAAKCIIESCNDVRVDLEDYLISGTLEMIDCENVTVSINPQDKLPTVSAERCRNIHLYYYEPQAFGSVYTVACLEVFVHFQPPHQEEYELELPGDNISQFVSELRGTKMIVSKVIREGAGHATTVEKQRLALLKEKEMQRQVEAYLSRLITIKPKQNKPAVQASTQSSPPQGDQSVSRSKPSTSSPTESKSESADSTTPQADPLDNPLAAAIQAKRKDLKPTETVERSLPVVGVEERRGTSRYNIEDEESKREYFDEGDALEKKLDKVTSWVKNSKHIIIFTGAGISTSAGIPDFRSGMNTVLKTGPGVWELMAHQSRGREGSVVKPMLQALPTSTHMAIVRLTKAGLVKFTVSQNVDGLHRRSGLGPSQLAELHGNTNLETCDKCNRQYLRDFETREAAHVFDHRTSRSCDNPNCKGVLNDSIINFGENLPELELKNAFEHAGKADLCIVLGSSLRVRPACQVPEVIQQAGGKVVICNLQRIPQFPQDNRTLQVFTKCDDFMSGLMKRLELDTPPFTLTRRVRITMETKENGEVQVTVTGLDRDQDLPYSFIKGVTVDHDGHTYEAHQEPLLLTLPSQDIPTLVLHFHGHYGEPPLPISLSQGSKVYRMNYYPMTGKWEVEE